MRKNMANFVVLCFMLMIALQVSPSYAAGPQLNVLSVEADLENGLLLINGENFYWIGNEDLTVLLAGDQLDINISSKTAIEAVLPGGITAGTYLLEVSRGTGLVQNAGYEVTIGAEGPEGPQGPQGSQGPSGVTYRDTKFNSIVFSNGINDGFETISATCDSGWVLTGCSGYFNLVCLSDGDCEYLGARPSGSSTCYATAYNESGSNATLIVYARCAYPN